jgi:hypothetical protein
LPLTGSNGKTVWGHSPMLVTCRSLSTLFQPLEKASVSDMASIYAAQVFHPIVQLLFILRTQLQSVDMLLFRLRGILRYAPLLAESTLSGRCYRGENESDGTNVEGEQ